MGESIRTDQRLVRLAAWERDGQRLERSEAAITSFSRLHVKKGLAAVIRALPSGMVSKRAGTGACAKEYETSLRLEQRSEAGRACARKVTAFVAVKRRTSIESERGAVDEFTSRAVGQR